MLILNVCYILMIDILNFSSEIAPVNNTQDFTGDQSTFVQVMAWCHQAKIITWTNVDFALCPSECVAVWLHAGNVFMGFAIGNATMP